jgi:hypothetical protein
VIGDDDEAEVYYAQLNVPSSFTDGREALKRNRESTM